MIGSHTVVELQCDLEQCYFLLLIAQLTNSLPLQVIKLALVLIECNAAITALDQLVPLPQMQQRTGSEHEGIFGGRQPERNIQHFFILFGSLELSDLLNLFA